MTLCSLVDRHCSGGSGYLHACGRRLTLTFLF